ncbi:DUF302 domain-containing protein [Paenibacillus sp. Soil750]|uniref:DUF302 domain-containing protein n=1 Tax=Paenibacillus sp. Soil750 TaxID=1736398 RepID=UPI0006F99CAF|nr:DUF302 domain-containing protein [Paenibacillus sp. Soil750]KRE71971.1 hypothetical protein ASL11_09340 [Paenibacillus sp. Soil750]
MFHYTIETDKSVDEVIEALTTNLYKEHFGILWKFNIQEKLQEKGLEFEEPYIILEVCNPFEAKRVLSEHAVAGYFLPCKIAVYVEKGTTKIGMPRPTNLIGMVEMDAYDQLLEIAQDVEKRLINCLDRSI